MHSRGIILVSLFFAAACSNAPPPAAGDTSPIAAPRATGTDDAGSTEVDDTVPDDDASAPDGVAPADAGMDAFDGYFPPPPSQCNAAMTIGSATVARAGARFAGITRDERTIAWTETSGDKTSLFVADRDAADEEFAAPQLVSTDAATDGVALTDDGLGIVAVATGHRSFVVYERTDRDAGFAVGDDSAYDALVAALDPSEQLGDPVFINSGVALLYSVFGKSADTMRMGSRISIYASFNPTSTLAFPEFRAQGALRRRPTGTGPDFQVIFYWDEVTQSEKLARLNGTEYVLGVKDLGAHPWAQANGACGRIWFGGADISSAPSF